MLIMVIFPNEKYTALKQLLKTPTLINTADFLESFLLNLDRWVGSKFFYNDASFKVYIAQMCSL